MTPITEEWAVKAGFKKVTDDTFKLEVNLSYDGERIITIARLPKGWIAYYEVNKIAASSVKYYIEEVKELYKGLTGKEI